MDRWRILLSAEVGLWFLALELRHTDGNIPKVKPKVRICHERRRVEAYRPKNMAYVNRQSLGDDTGNIYNRCLSSRWGII